MRDGRVPLDSGRWRFVDGPVEELFSQAFADAPFEFTEISFSNYLISIANGTAKYRGLPIFTSRSFRHSALYVRADAGISRPAQLAGHRVGLREYTNTAALVTRGILTEEYGVDLDSIDWVVGDIEPPFRSRVALPTLDRSLSVSPVVGESLSALLEAGQLDALISYSEPSCFANGAAVRLFPDFRTVEQEYFRRTRLFPIMHLLAIRADVAETIDRRHVLELLSAFAEAKQISQRELQEQQALRVMLPWTAAEFADTTAIMGTDFWSYGLDRNRHVIQSQIRYAREQGLIGRLIEVDDLFLNDDEIEGLLSV
jgi:4,5-dihydroxyphthalate decarboxylase